MIRLLVIDHYMKTIIINLVSVMYRILISLLIYSYSTRSSKRLDLFLFDVSP